MHASYHGCNAASLFLTAGFVGYRLYVGLISLEVVLNQLCNKLNPSKGLLAASLKLANISFVRINISYCTRNCGYIGDTSKFFRQILVLVYQRHFQEVSLTICACALADVNASFNCIILPRLQMKRHDFIYIVFCLTTTVADNRQ
jgi:hypothetical protein